MNQNNNKLNNIKNATCIIYCRVSSKEQTENTSLNDQEILCINFAKKCNIFLCKEKKYVKKFKNLAIILKMV